MFEGAILTKDFQYLILFSSLLFVPKVFQRFKVPSGITSFVMGVICINVLHSFKDDELIVLLSRVGITSLFLLAGLEVDLKELIEEKKALIFYILKSTALIFIIGYVLTLCFAISYRAGVVYSLGLMTPSAGFILHSLKTYELTEKQEKWIRIKALAFEISAILILFIVLQSNSMSGLMISNGLLLLFVFGLPFAFKAFFKFVAPYAPNSELSFLVLVALLGGVFTRNIGAYYLVGAFIAGLMANEFKYLMNDSFVNKLEPSLELFVSFFVPFYFFAAGLKITTEYFTSDSILLALTLLAIFLPLRILSVYSSILMNIKDSWKSRNKIALSLVPTLVFGLVIAGILKEQYDTSNLLIGALVIYTIISTLVPAFFLKKTPPEF